MASNTISNEYNTCNGNVNNDLSNKILFFSDLRSAQDLNEKTFVFVIKYNNFILGASQNFSDAKNWVDSYTSQITSALTLSNKYLGFCGIDSLFVTTVTGRSKK